LTQTDPVITPITRGEAGYMLRSHTTFPQPDGTAVCRKLSSVPPADLPYVLVRIMESYVYLSLFTGDQPDAARASSVIHALLPRRPGRG
jgi:Tetracyclin repressor-like, C-terminal domain